MDAGTFQGGSGRRTAVIFDRQPLWLDALGGVVAEAGFDVVGTSTEPDAAVAVAKERNVDMLVACFEARDGEELFRRARRDVPGAKLVALGGDVALVEAAFAAGASVYVLKRAQPDEIATAVRQAFSRSLYLSGQAFATGTRPAVDERDLPLTKREREILTLTAGGMSNSAMARKLWLTEQTIKFHLSNVYRKLNVSNRTEASRWAFENGLLTAAAA